MAEFNFLLPIPDAYRGIDHRWARALCHEELEFLLIFRRFEYAMLRAANGGKEPADDAASEWNGLAAFLGPDFFREIEDAGMASTILRQPPPPRDTATLLSVTRRVFIDLPRDRDATREASHRKATLALDAVQVIEAILRRNPELKRYYESPD
jgi:hypothetical protein